MGKAAARRETGVQPMWRPMAPLASADPGSRRCCIAAIEARPPRCYRWPDMATTTDKPRARLGNLRLVWRHASRYPRHIAAALFFLALSSTATLAIPYGFSRVIDRGFGSGGAVEAAAVATTVAAQPAKTPAKPTTPLNAGI